MSRYLFTVKGTFLIEGRGLVLVPGIIPIKDESFRVGDLVVLKKPDSSEDTREIGGIEMFCPPPRDYPVVIMLNGIEKNDVPIGTEIWSV